MMVPTLGKAFAYVLRSRKTGAGLPTSEDCRQAVKLMVDFLDLYSETSEEQVKDITEEVRQWFFDGNHGAFPMTSCLRQALENRRHPLSKKGEARVMLVQLRIAKIMCDNLESAHGSGHIAGFHMELAYWLAQAIYPEDRIASRRLMRVSGKCLSGKFVDAFFWHLQTEAKGKFGHMVEQLLEALTEGMLQANHPVEMLAQYLRRSGRGKKVSDAAAAAFEERRRERDAARGLRDSAAAR